MIKYILPLIIFFISCKKPEEKKIEIQNVPKYSPPKIWVLNFTEYQQFHYYPDTSYTTYNYKVFAAQGNTDSIEVDLVSNGLMKKRHYNFINDSWNGEGKTEFYNWSIIREWEMNITNETIKDSIINYLIYDNGNRMIMRDQSVNNLGYVRVVNLVKENYIFK